MILLCGSLVDLKAEKLLSYRLALHKSFTNFLVILAQYHSISLSMLFLFSKFDHEHLRQSNRKLYFY